MLTSHTIPAMMNYSDDFILCSVDEKRKEKNKSVMDEIR